MDRLTSLSALAGHIDERGWQIESRVRGIAGSLIIVSVILAANVSQWWLLLAAFVGFNLLQSAFTNYCLMSNLLAIVFPSLRHREP